MIIEWIKELLDEPEDERDPTRLTLSSAGKCGRQLAYRRAGTNGIPIGWRAKSIFRDGNLFHDQLRGWIERAKKPPCYKLLGRESEVKLITPKGREIVGHIDGLIWHDPECQEPDHDRKLLEVKTMSSTGWRMLKYEGLEKSYVAQVCCYLKGLGLQACQVVCKCKDNSDLREFVIQRDDLLVEECMARFDSILDAASPDMVQRMYGPKEDGSLPWQCGYCPYWQTCWAEQKPVAKEEHKIKLTGGVK